MTAITPAALGFTVTPDGWQKVLRGRTLTFRLLHEWAEFEAVECLQRTVFGVSDHDLIAASILIVIPKTGGQILGAFAGEELVGFLTAYGGYVARRPLLVSDMLAVAPAWRGGLGFALKALQAALALTNGFPTITWTVDPLRAANARLNFERLGAYARSYHDDFYGSDFASGLYGGLPTDRLVVIWPIDQPLVADRLLGKQGPRDPGTLDSLPVFAAPGPTQARVPIPADIDSLVATNLDAARDWRFRVRAALHEAFAAGYVITGFASARDGGEGQLLLTQADYAEQR
jgi:predicted GNAT superfamily acetyltransferase